MNEDTTRPHGVTAQTDGTTNQERVNRALDLLRHGLAPFVARELRKKVQAVPHDRLHQLAEDRNLAERPIDDWDVLALLKLMEATWDSAFRGTLGRIERGLVSELREWRNRWAHQVRFRVLTRSVLLTPRNGFSLPYKPPKRANWPN